MGEDCLGVCVVPPPRNSPPEFASSVGLGAAMHWPPDLWEGYDLQDLTWALEECPVRYARITQRPREYQEARWNNHARPYVDLEEVTARSSGW
jgi:hypothetical protein